MKLLYTETAVVIGLVNIFMPFMVLPLMAAIERIPPSLEEAARNLGANWWQMFRRTILPLSLPGLISGCLLVYSVSISAFVTPALMGSPRERMVGQQIYDEVLVSFNWPSASSLAVTLVLLTLLLMFCALYATRRAGRLETDAADERPRPLAAAAVRGRGLCRAAGAAGGRHRGVVRPQPEFRVPAERPDLALVRGVFRQRAVRHVVVPGQPGGRPPGGGARHFARHRRRDRRSSASASSAARRWRRSSSRRSWCRRSCSARRSTCSMRGSRSPPRSGRCCAGHLVICTPYVIRSVTAGLVGMDPRLEEAAMSLGATRLQAFFKVTLPLLRSSLLSGAIFAFIISFSDINLALFLSGPESTSLPVHLFSQIQWQGDPTIAAASALQIVIIGALILVVQRIFRLRLMV